MVGASKRTPKMANLEGLAILGDLIRALTLGEVCCRPPVLAPLGTLPLRKPFLGTNGWFDTRRSNHE
jgi:hypothetical protein